jgi:DNA-binding CsgD family transcriptional regulator
MSLVDPTHPFSDSAPILLAGSALLDGVHGVLDGSLLNIAGSFSAMLQPVVGHSALVIFTEDCTGRPQKKAGDAQIIDHVSIAELDAVRSSLGIGEHLESEERMIAGRLRAVAVWVAPTGALLVLTDPMLPAGGQSDAAYGLVASAWSVVAQSIRHQVATAGPAYLLDSRSTSTERARVIAELSDDHAMTLESLLAVLRSERTGDAAARQSAAELAAAAMVRLRSLSDRDRALAEEPVIGAFARLRDDLAPLVRFGGLDVQFVEPPVNGRALPGEVAHAARAIVRGAVLALVEQPGVNRVRVQWDCDGSNLLVNIRDDGPGDLQPDGQSVRQLTARATALDGTLNVESTPGWGSEVAVALPLDAPAITVGPSEWGLSAREREVLELVASGARNRSIAGTLSISENTVKFHVANLLRKAGASTRAELAVLAL